LPVIVTTAVDLSRVDTSIVIQISSFLGTSRELLNLALTCKSFGWRQPASTLNWSLVEEVARQAVCSNATDGEMSSLPQHVGGTTTWLSILHRFEHPLIFDVLLGGGIEHRNGNLSKVYGTGDGYVCTAVSSHCVMRLGAHYAEFQIAGEPWIGIVRPMPNLDAGAYQEGGFDFISVTDDHPSFVNKRSDDWGDSDVHACEINTMNGRMGWTNWVDGDIQGVEWEGMEECQSGDTVGLLLNLNDGTLTVYRNNRRLGVMKNGLSGSYCWHTVVVGSDVDEEKDAVAIHRGTLPTVNNM